jgi:hypothetical protein
VWNDRAIERAPAAAHATLARNQNAAVESVGSQNRAGIGKADTVPAVKHPVAMIFLQNPTAIRQTRKEGARRSGLSAPASHRYLCLPYRAVRSTSTISDAQLLQSTVATNIQILRVAT